MDLLAEEAQIARRAQSGDQTAFADLVSRYTGAVYNQAYRMLNNAQEAEDAVQEVFLRAYRRLDSYDPSRRFVTWLLTIGSNYCIDRLRPSRRMSWLTLDDVAFWLTSGEAGPERRALEGERQHQIQRALQQIPESYRGVTVLRYWHDLSYLEIAEALSLTEATVKTRLHRARKMLRDALEADGRIIMGRGDPELTPDDELLSAAEAETRRLLARYGQPQSARPPADLSRRVLGALAAPQPDSRGSRLRRIYGGLVIACLLALLALGAWGVLLDSSGPARLFGDLSGGLSQLVLLLTLAAKPLINLLLAAGAQVALVLAAIVGGSWLWWQLLRRELAVSMEAGI